METNEFGGLPYYERLVLKIKQEIVTGIRQPDDKLPSVRDMAKEVKLNPNTVAKAYKQLEAEQVVVVRPGLGTFVNPEQPMTDELKNGTIKSKFKQLIIEAKAAGITEADLQDWLDEAFVGGLK